MTTRLSTLIHPEPGRGSLPDGSKEAENLPQELLPLRSALCSLPHAKRKRGGQPGNQNARTHGFFSDNLSPAEINEFWSVTSQEDIEPEVALLRLKFQSFFLSGSANPRVIKKASRLLTKWYGKGLNRSDTKYLKSVIDCTLYDLVFSANIKKLTKTNRAYFNNLAR